jgi:isoleucyl-tRNA synthetase
MTLNDNICLFIYFILLLFMTAFGEDDYRACLVHGIVSKGEDLPCPVDANGRFTSQVPDFFGKGVKEADNDICAHLKAAGRLVMKLTTPEGVTNP